ncbi:MAG: DUF6065 family protein [Parvularculaceae bacterium]
MKEIECFVEEGADFRIRPSSHRRDWMDGSPESYAYRCLPLAIANSHGWDLLNQTPFTANWNGGPRISDISLTSTDGALLSLVTSHFGEGVLTFHIPCLIRTPPGYDLWVMGPANAPKANIQALNAVVETDWSPYTFTMNWKFTSANKPVSFAIDEPIATIFPVKRGEIETFQPVLKSPADDPEFWQVFTDWRDARNNFNAELKKPGSDAEAQGWQKTYMTGPQEKLAPPHRTRLRLSDIKKVQSEQWFRSDWENIFSDGRF